MSSSAQQLEIRNGATGDRSSNAGIAAIKCFLFASTDFLVFAMNLSAWLRPNGVCSRADISLLTITWVRGPWVWHLRPIHLHRPLPRNAPFRLLNVLCRQLYRLLPAGHEEAQEASAFLLVSHEHSMVSLHTCPGQRRIISPQSLRTIHESGPTGNDIKSN